MIATSPDEESQKKTSNPAISFVGISNWTIDVSKMNRNVFLSRPNPIKQDLYETAKMIIKFEMKSINPNKEDLNSSINERAKFIAQIYYNFRKNQYENFPHKNFHSLRDFYWLLKNIGKEMKENIINNDEEFIKISMDSIFKNFSGYYYINKKKVYSYNGKKTFIHK